MEIPKIGEKLGEEQVNFLKAFAKSCRKSIVEMVVNADSGHPGGSLSTIDYLSVLYAFILSQSGEPVIVSNGHISPAVYSVLAEMGYVDKEDVVANFRKAGSRFEGHVTRHVDGVFYGTGPLGTGISAAAGFAVAERVRAEQKGETPKRTFGVLGDGEAQEGQVYEMMNFAAKYKMDNFIVFMDYNQVQLTDSLAKIMPLQVKAHFQAAGWNVIDVDGHDYSAIWHALSLASAPVADGVGRPVLLLGHTIMGKGAGEMEKDGLEYKATWHGKSPGVEMGAEVIAGLTLSSEEEMILKAGMNVIRGSQNFWKPAHPNFPVHGSVIAEFDAGEPHVYAADEKTDCRSAYGNALKDLGSRNKNILVFDADLEGSVKTDGFHKAVPERFFQCGIAEQHMVSASGGASLDGFIPFCSTFGAFMTSRAKDQARVNDINQANVKMVSTHCGLSVGEDGPTHQAIDDMGAFRPFFNTVVLEPADPNHCDRIIRHVASHYGNYYVRMGRHKLPTLTKADGSIFFDADYVFEEGKFDLLREGEDITIVASGPMVIKALEVMNELAAEGGPSVEIIIANSPSILDESLIMESVQKTGRLITIEDQNPYTGIGSQVIVMLIENGVTGPDWDPLKINRMGVREYQLSGTPEELYDMAGLGNADIKKTILEMTK
ncbi:MAG: transketolase [Candidatus Peregrinibacteria bacterium]|nr:transketolase [Candidatus Peregrinibacteria bacterium]MDZ4244787.1 transketolase [Candidatus Gracilibacteria bacterium]